MISNNNLIFKSVSHVENFQAIINSEYPNIYKMLCDGKKVKTFEIAYYYILSSFLDVKILLEIKTNAYDYNFSDFLTIDENILLDYAYRLLLSNKLDLSVFNRISDDYQVLLKTGFDIAFDELSITTDVLFDVISSIHQREIELNPRMQEHYELER